MGSDRTHELIRLNKFIAQSGLTSRRKADHLVTQGQVKVNGKTISDFGIQIDPSKDRVTVSGRPIQTTPQRPVCYMFYKPKNVLTTMDDPMGRVTVADHIALLKSRERLFPVGRLDWQSEGLLIITNDGNLAQKIMHPKEEIAKTYMAKLSGTPTEAQLNRLRRGTSIVGGRVRATSLIPIKQKGPNASSKQNAWYKVIIEEGKNRQIRQMFSKIGYDVLKLQRVAIGRLRIGSLQPGEWRQLGDEDVAKIFAPRPEELQERRLKKPRSNKRYGNKEKASPR